MSDKQYNSVLIAEDDENTAFYFSEILKHTFKKILIAENGVDAIQLCKENTDLELVLMDMKMPEMSGYDAVQNIRKFNKEISIIGQTAYAFPNDQKKVLGAGCNDYITKPINRDELMDKIKRLLNGKTQ